MSSESKVIYARTSLMYSKPLSDLIQREVYLKLENTQPCGSFKLRGISHSCQEKLKNGCTRFLGTSGGNAGLALAYTAEQLKVPCDIFVPEYVTPRMLKKLKSYGATINVIGKDWLETNAAAMGLLENHPEIGFVHPFDDPMIWEGHASIIQEIKEDLQGRKPSCIVVSVGGGGLATGVLKGLEAQGWNEVPLLCMENAGAECFNLSVKAGKQIVMEELTSVAMGARSCTQALLDSVSKFNIVSEVLPDKEAVLGCIRLADDHGFLVEPSCGVALAAIYCNLLPEVMESRGYSTETGPIIIIVCGGSNISHGTLKELANMFELNLGDKKPK
ncbi:L-serine dehydratase/L-threonine deaminase [Orchesella cincta]|uniref:L-serine ammonia-lyase n=1 Tax=Orchesella cincta TaxID=48709 RepID=A0A1D2MMQ9_ORCCI|nr:L-serine dehydratase/L-threonine deaminase [Orchesella cincta]